VHTSAGGASPLKSSEDAESGGGSGGGENGGWSPDGERAIRFLKTSAELGYADAQVHL
jgi:hypothetical protein